MWIADADASVTTLAASGTTVYVGGHFSQIGGQQRNWIAALDAHTGGVRPGIRMPFLISQMPMEV
jgi:hypothetical protein